MSTKRLFLLVSVVAAVASARADEPAKAACCAVEKPACCAVEKRADSATAVLPARLSARSIYQLGATWTSDAGKPVQLASFRGHPVVLTMFFASCEYACPLLVADLHRVREALPAEVREQAKFVLVSFDPERDTPAALNAYRKARALDGSWTLLSGDAHSNIITVLNADGEIAFQRNGLQGDVGESVRAIVAAAKK
jgi:protein SCO1